MDGTFIPQLKRRKDMSEKLKYEKNKYGHYRISIDGLEFNSLRQAKVHIKNKRARARRRLNG